MYICGSEQWNCHLHTNICEIGSYKKCDSSGTELEELDIALCYISRWLSHVREIMDRYAFVILWDSVLSGVARFSATCSGLAHKF